MNRSAAEWIAAAKGGDTAALGHLLLSRYSMLTSFVTPKMPQRLAADLSVEDVIQDVFAIVFRDIHEFEFRGEGSFDAWLKLICEHRLQDAIRRLTAKKRGGEFKRVQRTAVPKGGMAGSALHLIDVLIAEDPTASELFAKDEGVNALRIALASLPDNYQQVIRLRYLEERSIADTAAEMELSEAAVRSLTDRAKTRLRDALGSISRYLLSNR